MLIRFKNKKAIGISVNTFAAFVFALLIPSLATAQETDVKGGFFSKDKASGNLFDRQNSGTQLPGLNLPAATGSTKQAVKTPQQKAALLRHHLPALLPGLVSENGSFRAKELSSTKLDVIQRKSAAAEKKIHEYEKQGSPLTNPQTVPQYSNLGDNFNFDQSANDPKSVAAGARSTFFKQREDAKSQRATLSLVVNAVPETNLQEALEKLRYAKQRLNVKVGQVVVVGMLEYSEKYLLPKMHQYSETQEDSTEEVRQLPINNNLKQKLLRVRTQSQLNSMMGEIKGEQRNLERLASQGKLKSVVANRVKASIVMPNIFSATREIGLTAGSKIPIDQLLKKYDISNSPAWIVRHENKDYVFEGEHDPAHFFNTNGEFIYRGER